MRQNAFHQNIPSIHDIVKNQEIRKYIAKVLVPVLANLHVNNPEAVVNDVIAMAGESTATYEEQAHQLLATKGVTEESISDKLSGRASLIYDQIKEYVLNGNVLDLGCGDGKVGEKLAEAGLEVALADVYQHQHIPQTGLPFKQCTQGKNIPYEPGQFDNVLLLTVMHHSDDPLKTLQEAARLTKKGGRLIVIESVYGIKDASPFGNLSFEQQRQANIFFDHFYNRVIHYSSDPAKKVNVPYNFNTPEGWKNIFEQHGLTQVAVKQLGIDQPLVPEYHTLHVLEK